MGTEKIPGTGSGRRYLGYRPECEWSIQKHVTEQEGRVGHKFMPISRNRGRHRNFTAGQTDYEWTDTDGDSGVRSHLLNSFP